MNTLDTEISRRVREARKSAGLSQEEVGEHLGLTRGGYGHYERGRQPFTVEQLFRLSRILGEPVEYFLGLDTELTSDEKKLLDYYRRIDPPELREVALESVRLLADSLLRRKPSGGI